MPSISSVNSMRFLITVNTVEYLTHSRRKITIWRLPNTLVIHFKKIGFDTLGKQVEIKEAVKFPIKGFSLDEYYDEHSRGTKF